MDRRRSSSKICSSMDAMTSSSVWALTIDSGTATIDFGTVAVMCGPGLGTRPLDVDDENNLHLDVDFSSS